MINPLRIAKRLMLLIWLGQGNRAIQARLETVLNDYVIKHEDSCENVDGEKRLKVAAASRIDHLNRVQVALGLALFFDDVHRTFLAARDQARRGRAIDAITLIAKLRFRVGFNDNNDLAEPVYYARSVVCASVYEISDELYPRFGTDALNVLESVLELVLSERSKTNDVIAAILTDWLHKHGQSAGAFVRYAERIKATSFPGP